MEFERDRLALKRLVSGWTSGSIVRNAEYQRGEAWGLPQKQALIDSVFRDYPIPPLFLHERSAEGLRGATSKKFEIIDGQQRILAAASYLADEFELLKVDDPKLRLPASLRTLPADWGGRRFSHLDTELRTRIEEAQFDVFFVTNVRHEDEIRDLFIRLQSGTALTRQQIRDAWPGGVGPVVEEFAGKLAKRPKYRVFQAVDGRGIRDDEDDSRDPYVKHRQTCAQLLRILFARMVDPRHFPSVEAGDVDAFYHQHTDITRDSPAIQEVEFVLENVQKVTDALAERWSGRKKLPKMTVFAIAFFFQDIHNRTHLKMGPASRKLLGDYSTDFQIKRGARTVSGPAIKAMYEQWRAGLPVGVGIELDPKRTFDAHDQSEIRRKNPLCGICDKEVLEAEGEFDHFPVPHSWGGKTIPENGRLVHSKCHPRGNLGNAGYPGHSPA